MSRGFTVPISVIIPTWNRGDMLLATLGRMRACSPAPDQILVHVDAGDKDTSLMLASAFPEVGILRSAVQVGPGGGRNKLMAAARNELVASFDDDSFPLDRDYFARLNTLFAMFPAAAVIASAIYHRDEPLSEANSLAGPTAHFIGCGAAYRRTAFLAAGGYVPLPVAYGMEEVDLAMRLHALGFEIWQSPWLRVYHDTLLSHHASEKITAASISNLALLAYLRYPAHMWAYGLLQVINRVAWLVRAGRFRGIWKGLTCIPGHLWRHRERRKPVPTQHLRQFLRMRREAPKMHRIELQERSAT